MDPHIFDVTLNIWKTDLMTMSFGGPNWRHKSLKELNVSLVKKKGITTSNAFNSIQQLSGGHLWTTITCTSAIWTLIS